MSDSRKYREVAEMSLLEEVEKLRDAPLPDVRVSVAQKVARFFEDNVFDKFENKLACEVLRLLTRDVEVRVRKTLSESLKANTSIPRDIAVTLAKDVLEVSTPMLAESPVLTDEDLVEIVESAEEVAKLEIIANRQHVSKVLSGALISRKQNKVTATLLSNHGAEIAESDFIEVLNDCSEDASIVEKMVFRGDLPISIAARVMEFVSDALKEELKSKYHLDGKTVDEIAEQSLEKSTLGLLDQTQTAAKSEVVLEHHGDVDVPNLNKLVDPVLMKKTKELCAYLQRNNKLTPSIVLRALCEGNLPFFEVGISHLAGIPIVNAHMLVWAPNPTAFQSLFNRAHMPKATLQAVELILLFIKQEAITSVNMSAARQQIRRRVVERILSGGYNDSVPLMPYFVALINSKMTTEDVI